MAREKNTKVWGKQFGPVIGVVMELSADPDAHIRELALRVIREMLRHQASFVGSHDNAVLTKLLERYKACPQDFNSLHI